VHIVIAYCYIFIFILPFSAAINILLYSCFLFEIDNSFEYIFFLILHLFHLFILLFCTISRYAMLCYAIRCDAMRCDAMLSYPILSYPILSYPILSYPILSYPILSYPILSYPILSYPILSYHPSILFSPFLQPHLTLYQTISGLSNHTLLCDRYSHPRCTYDYYFDFTVPIYNPN
jgi:hypothetical protein